MIAFPNAKINLGLNIIEKRTDGFHNIETIFYPVPWCDALEIIPGNKNDQPVTLSTSGNKVYSKENQNLCVRAYHLLAENHELPPVKMHLHKVIPIGAGLGGGSSDASQSLLLMNTIFNLKLKENILREYALQLGSDCPFFTYNKPMFATGKGDELETIKLDLKNYFIVLVKPKVHVSTSEAYKNIVPKKPSGSLKEFIRLPVNKWKETIQNDFEKSIFEKFKVIKNVKEKLYKYGAVYASMSGSGSTVYGIFTEEKKLADSFRNCEVWSGLLR
jgi:4-diphosphocytidyl-2-C-methyl-D-erythritol kinase